MQVKDEVFCEECLKVFHAKYEVVDVLGRGSFGTVFHAQRKQDKAKFAVKRLDMDKSNLTQAAREVQKITSIGCHPGFIIFEDVFFNEHHSNPVGHLYIAMELCERVTLREWLESNQSDRGWILMRDWVMQLARALDHLHKNHAIHRDLKPANVFFSRSASFQILKIGGFGLATRAISETKEEGSHMQKSGNSETAYYMAPEQASQQYDEKVDIFALGLITAELLILKSPTYGVCTNDIIRSGQWPIAWLDYPDALQFLSQLTSLNAKERPSAADVLMHPFIQ